jgi:hypothetical protein
MASTKPAHRPVAKRITKLMTVRSSIKKLSFALVIYFTAKGTKHTKDHKTA